MARTWARTLTDRASARLETLETRCSSQPIVERVEGGFVLEFFLKMETTGQVDGVPGAQGVSLEKCLRPRHYRWREFYDEHRRHIGVEHGQRSLALLV